MSPERQPLFEDQLIALLDELPENLRPLIKKYLITAQKSEDWLLFLPKESDQSTTNKLVELYLTIVEERNAVADTLTPQLNLKAPQKQIEEVGEPSVSDILKKCRYATDRLLNGLVNSYKTIQHLPVEDVIQKLILKEQGHTNSFEKIYNAIPTDTTPISNLYPPSARPSQSFQTK